MRILHTSDWHVGRTIRGRSREHEHATVLAGMVRLVEEEQVDLVLVAGDQFDSAAPSARAERLVYRTLLAMHDRGARVVVIAGNHDNAGRLGALRGLLGRAGIVVADRVREPERGGVEHVVTRSGEARVALVPFLSQRGIVTSADLLDADQARHAQAYAQRVKVILDALATGFGGGDTVDLIVGHLTVVGGDSLSAGLGGGERLSQIFDYVVPPQAFPVTAQYVALGHLHQPHTVPAPAPVRYAGSPLHLDFGEVASARGVTLVDVEPGRPARSRHVPLEGGYALQTLTGTVSELEAQAAGLGERVYVRAVVDEAPRAGLADEVRAVVPQAVDVRIAEHRRAGAPRGPELDDSVAGGSPAALFDAYLTARGVEDDRLGALFRTLLDDVEAGERGE